jgi:bifunctional DNase/RNase
MGAVIGMFLRDTPKERPLTHDLINRIFQGFGISVERVVITDLKNSTYFARLILQQQNELHTERKIVELDARPSDCLALAAAQKKPIFVAASLFAGRGHERSSRQDERVRQRSRIRWRQQSKPLANGLRR